MLLYCLKRLGLALLVIIVVSLVGFFTLRLSGDPAVAMAGEASSQADVENIRRQYGFDRPLIIQYFDWLGRAVRGDFGTSNYFRLPVSDLIMSRFPITAILAALSIGFALTLAIPLGIVAAVRQNSWVDRLALFLAVAGQAIPTFWLGLLLIMVLSVTFPLLPPSGSDQWVNFVMPTIVLGTHAMPALMRLTRNGMLDVLASDYRSEEHTSELQSLMRISYAVFCLKKKTTQKDPMYMMIHRHNTKETNTQNTNTA